MHQSRGAQDLVAKAAEDAAAVRAAGMNRYSTRDMPIAFVPRTQIPLYAHEHDTKASATKLASMSRITWMLDNSSDSSTRFMMSADDMYQKEAAAPMGEDDEEFNTALQTPSQTYWWFDKYRPRKPRYLHKFNLVHSKKENRLNA